MTFICFNDSHFRWSFDGNIGHFIQAFVHNQTENYPIIQYLMLKNIPCYHKRLLCRYYDFLYYSQKCLPLTRLVRGD
ncbi:hypothetical protein EG68_07186 [Paragonimus skrjabini miyazakii]|uniref:Uncharacterized protein n=1 Tax=Paragonimus skrjabini miyazakii TaxID=59628 RepID=A0A8S9YSG3_9TREM|nr:hypothetical protein EG68_07186 [Paragonimus skrjabini miyazakii]